MIKIDTWARSRITVAQPDFPMLSDEAEQPRDPMTQSSLSVLGGNNALPRSNTMRTTGSRRLGPGSPGPGSAMIENDPKKQMQAWKESALAFLQHMSEEEMPVPVQLKQIIERPTTGEQKLRALKEQQLIKDRIKQREEKAKLERLEKEKKLIRSNKGTVTYDFDGKPVEIKPVANQKQTSLTNALQYELFSYL